MQIFVLGGTGSIGAAVVAALIRRGHGVTALARSDVAAQKLTATGILARTQHLFRGQWIPLPRVLGEWARGYAMDQQMSGDKARRDLDWRPAWNEPLADLTQPD